VDRDEPGRCRPLRAPERPSLAELPESITFRRSIDSVRAEKPGFVDASLGLSSIVRIYSRNFSFSPAIRNRRIDALT
jgi:hypothetical protein